MKEVTIAYTQETPEILKTIEALVNFLRVSCNVTVRFDIDDEVSVRENPLGWYKKGDQFIYIETEGSVLRESNYVNNRKTYHVEEDALDDAFLYSFIGTINNPKSMTNYSKYIVVHFTFTPQNVRFATVANHKRYMISMTEKFCHLPQLCNFINYGKDLTAMTESLQFYDKWKCTPQFQALRLAIDQATKFVHENPNYVNEIFRVSSCDNENDQLLD